MELKFIPIVFVSILSLANRVNCQCGERIPYFGADVVKPTRTEENYLMVGNIFNETSELKAGDEMECVINKLEKPQISKTDSHLFTEAQAGYIFVPISKGQNCFSFQVRTHYYPHILLSSAVAAQGQICHVLLDYTGKSMIRGKNNEHLNAVNTTDTVNNKELRGFWLRWLDDYFLEFGRDTDNYPLLSYRFPEKLNINFIGLLSYTVEGEWVIHGVPKCGQHNVNEKVLAETKCTKVAKRNLQKNKILENSQTHILNLIKKQQEIFKVSKFRSKEILLKYQNMLDKHYNTAEENQNKINADDNELYCPLKAETFHQINEKYFQFLEEIQMELSIFKEPTPSSENLITPYNGCCGCCIAPKLIDLK